MSDDSRTDAEDREESEPESDERSLRRREGESASRRRRQTARRNPRCRAVSPTDPLRRYFDEVSRYPLIDAQEEFELAIRFATKATSRPPKRSSKPISGSSSKSRWSTARCTPTSWT